MLWETREPSKGKRMRGSSRSARAAAGLAVRIFAEQDFAFGIVQDFSCSGMFIRTRNSLPLGSHCRVHITLAGKGELILSCLVVRSTKANKAQGAGLGLCFDDQQGKLDPDKMERLGQLLVDIRTLALSIDNLEEGQSVHGNLSVTPLACILSCLDASSISGQLHLDNASTCGALEIYEGQIVGFESETPTTRSSEQCIDHLLHCAFGSFVFSRTTKPKMPAQTTSVMDVLWRNLQEAEDQEPQP